MRDFFAEQYNDTEKKFYDETSNSIEWIDIDRWNRKRLFYNYLGTDFPYITVAANVDVTKPLAFAHKHKISFNLVMTYLCNKTADSIINYRYRFIDDKPFLIDHNRPLVNHLKKGEDIFVIGEGPWPCDDIITFCKECHENMENSTPDDMQDRIRYKIDIINYTSLPWIQFTGFVRTIVNCGVDNAPKFSFGKYFKAPEDSSRILMPLHNQSHHGLMDGVHVGRFYNQLQEACDSLM